MQQLFVEYFDRLLYFLVIVSVDFAFVWVLVVETDGPGLCCAVLFCAVPRGIAAGVMSLMMFERCKQDCYLKVTVGPEVALSKLLVNSGHRGVEVRLPCAASGRETDWSLAESSPCLWNHGA